LFLFIFVIKNLFKIGSFRTKNLWWKTLKVWNKCLTPSVKNTEVLKFGIKTIETFLKFSLRDILNIFWFDWQIMNYRKVLMIHLYFQMILICQVIIIITIWSYGNMESVLLHLICQKSTYADHCYVKTTVKGLQIVSRLRTQKTQFVRCWNLLKIWKKSVMKNAFPEK
jgi:hypothetical protein